MYYFSCRYLDGAHCFDEICCALGNLVTITLQFINMFVYHTCRCIYMEIHVHSTLALRNQKEKKGEVTHPTIYSPDKQTYIARDTWRPSLENWGGGIKIFCG